MPMSADPALRWGGGRMDNRRTVTNGNRCRATAGVLKI